VSAPRVLHAHVEYRIKGGEDTNASVEADVCRDLGFEVRELRLHSEDFAGLPMLTRLGIAASFENHSYGRRVMARALDEWLPDVVHFHNVFPLLGPGAITVARERGCATIQRIPNFRPTCIGGLHFRKGRTCRLCTAGRFVPGLVHKCYRGSRMQSLIMGRATRVWLRDFVAASGPHLWVPPTEFGRDLLVGAGAPASRIVVKPNAVARSVLAEGPREGYVFVGRLSPEKGVLGLVRAWPRSAPTLRVVGDGPLRDVLSASVGPNVVLVGREDPMTVRRSLRSARALLFPSLCYEGALPVVVLEALAERTPVFAFEVLADAGVLREVSPTLVGNTGDYADLISRALACADSDEGLRERCLRLWERRHSVEAHRMNMANVYHQLGLDGQA